MRRDKINIIQFIFEIMSSFDGKATLLNIPSNGWACTSHAMSRLMDGSPPRLKNDQWTPCQKSNQERVGPIRQ